MFVTNHAGRAAKAVDMGSDTDNPAAVEQAVAERTDASMGAETASLDVRNLGPPKPLRETLERAEALGDDDILIQYNDRRPQFLFPRLDDRGFAYAAVETDATDAVATALWRSGTEDRSVEDAAAADDATAT
ncbi:DUF2249 domain-containing protein [Halorubrum sp. RMP-47]|uniref:DUF2249 domain-containing protein n=1 Tax=Halorubrum miltondacostae TaxID=3076378 RepID=A0ABD5M1X8_9EURY